MTRLETGDIAKELLAEADRGWPDKAPLLKRAAEAIEWLRALLDEAEGVVEWLEDSR